MKILVVDDEPTILQQVQDFLIRKGHKVVGFRSGDDALRAALGGGFDAALVDVRMPGMNGIAVMQELHRTNPTLPVVMMSGYTDVSPEDILAEGAAAWLDKPFTDPDRVVQTLKKVSGKE